MSPWQKGEGSENVRNTRDSEQGRARYKRIDHLQAAHVLTLHFQGGEVQMDSSDEDEGTWFRLSPVLIVVARPQTRDNIRRRLLPGCEGGGCQDVWDIYTVFFADINNFFPFFYPCKSLHSSNVLSDNHNLSDPLPSFPTACRRIIVPHRPGKVPDFRLRRSQSGNRQAQSILKPRPKKPHHTSPSAVTPRHPTTATQRGSLSTRKVSRSMLKGYRWARRSSRLSRSTRGGGSICWMR